VRCAGCATSTQTAATSTTSSKTRTTFATESTVPIFSVA
jgi:hypothetical protein